jgi:hypothetical protein
MKKQPLFLSDDERMLVRLYRCADIQKRQELLLELGEFLWSRYFGERPYEIFVPMDVDLEDEHKWRDPYSVEHVIWRGIRALGDSSDTIFSAYDLDDWNAVEEFSRAATEVASKQMSHANYGEEFARDFLLEWRELVLWAIEKHSEREKCSDQEIDNEEDTDSH